MNVTAMLDSYRITPALVRKPPSERHAFLERRAKRWTGQLRQKWPAESFRILPHSGIPCEIQARVKPNDVSRIAGFPEIAFVRVDRIEGRRRVRRTSGNNEFYCVRAKVAVQVEGASTGYQTWEDRFVLVLASGLDDAKRKLRSEWKQYAAPYLNSDGELVRWQLEEIVDVYSTGVAAIDPTGTEVFSVLRQRRMKPEYEWRT